MKHIFSNGQYYTLITRNKSKIEMKSMSVEKLDITIHSLNIISW